MALIMCVCIHIGPADIGPALANNTPKTDDVFTQCLSVNVIDTMFIEPATEEELLCLVHNAKNKKNQKVTISWICGYLRK